MSITTFDVLISNGFIVDGTGAPGYYGDVGIRDGRIAKVGRLKGCDATRTIDASGKIVAPGHVTQHTHYDAALFWDPYCLDSGTNGITTVVNANCGFGFAPVRPEDAERTMLMMSTTEQIPVAHQRAAMPWDWETFPDWMDRLQGLAKGVNVSTYLPLNPLLIYVMGVDAAKTRSPNEQEMAELHRLINEAMDAGAIGVSMSSMGAEGNTHVDYDGTSMPTDSMDHDALVEICRAVVERGEGIIQVLSQIAIYGDRSITERLAELAHGSGVRVIHNAFLTNDQLGFLVPQDLEWLSEQRGMGRDITAGALLNRGWVEAGVRELDTAGGQFKGVRRIVACADDDEIRALLADDDFVEGFEAELGEVTAATGASGLAGQTVIDVGRNEELEAYLGRTLNDIADRDRPVRGRGLGGLGAAFRSRSPAEVTTDRRHGSRTKPCLTSTTPASSAADLTAAPTPRHLAWVTIRPICSSGWSANTACGRSKTCIFSSASRPLVRCRFTIVARCCRASGQTCSSTTWTICTWT